MIVCPVCEHAQAQGAECEVCGKRLLSGPAAAPAAPAVEGLEPTVLGGVGAVVASRMPDLEPTGHAPAVAVSDPTPEIEPTRAAAVEVRVEAAPGIERTAAEIPGDARTEVPLFVACRYCRTPSMPGERVCGRCGMRLPVFGGSAPREAPQQPTRCSCGAPVSGSLCPGCGARRT